MKMWYIYAMEYYSTIRRNEMIHATLGMSLKNLILSEKSQSQKLTLPSSIYMKHSWQVHGEETVDWCLPEAQGRRE